MLQYRSDTYDWGVPGGAMELGETTEETARRELFEETGLNAKIMQFIGVLSGKVYFNIQMEMKFLMSFICIRGIM